MRKLLTGAFLALTPLCAYAQTQTQIIASGAIKNAGSVITVGTVSITGADENGQAIPYADGDGTAHGTAPIVCKVVAGQITGIVQPDQTVSGTCTVPNSLMVPGGIYFNFNICDTSTGRLTSGKCFAYTAVPGVSGSVWDLGMFSPKPLNTALRAARVSVIPPHCDFAGFINNTTNHTFLGCDADGTYHVLGTTGPQGSPGPAPQLQIGTVTTLSPGAQATAALHGPATAPIIDLGIPQGQPGSGGNGSSTTTPVLADTATGIHYAVTTVNGHLQLSQTSAGTTGALTLGGVPVSIISGHLHLN